MAASFLTKLTAWVSMMWIRLGKLFHKHRYDIRGAEEIKVGLIGGRHTAFVILKCKCGDSIAFPEDNFMFALREGTEETIKFLASLRV